MSSANGLLVSSERPQQIDGTTPDRVGENIRVAARKRKFDNVDSQSHPDIGETFTIESNSNGLSLRPIRLTPKLLTSRSCLPLSYLDLGGEQDDVAGTHIFSARNASLEANLQSNASDQPLLIASSDASNVALFAIERIDAGLYALCRLGKWVNIKALENLHAWAQDRPLAFPKQRCIQHIDHRESEWWRPLAVGRAQDSQNAQPRKTDNARKTNVRLSINVHNPPPPVPSVARIQQPPAEDPPEKLGLAVPGIQTGGEILQPALPDPVEALALVKAQYQEALYLSRSSLAYFAKGPLSRARAAFLGASGTFENASMLVQYLRSCILTLAVMDKKYKDALPGVVHALPAGPLSEEDMDDVIASLQKKARKPNKDKIGRDGLYHGEEANVARWWLNRHSVNLELGSPDPGKDNLKALLLEQRAKETQLQIILALEVLALEALAPNKSNDSEPLHETIDDEAEYQPKKRKPKKPQDMKTLLDLSIDRLSIWQSMRIEDGKYSASNSHTNPPQELAAPKAADADHLKSFCVDVVLPFYGARLPEITTLLCQKLGGSKASSPARPPLAKAASASRLGEKPGVPVHRPPTKKPRRTLERVLTEEKTSRSSAPSLSRSTTDSVLPGLKREVSDTSLSTIPLNRIALQKSQRYSQREVDLKSVTQTAEAKMKKNINIQKELQGAIAALKKPNPRLAVKELVEAAEKRAAGSNSRKSKNPVRSAFAQGVQVTATPKGKRQRDVLGGLPRLPVTATVAAAEPEEIPPSSAFRVPSSVQRPSAPPKKDNEPRLPRPCFRPTIEKTPTRGPSKHSQSLLSTMYSNGPNPLFLTPSKPRRSLDAVSQPLHYADSSGPQPSTTTSERGLLDSDIQETPLKPHIHVVEQSRSFDSNPLLDSSPPNTSIALGTQLGQEAPNIPSSPPVTEEASSRALYETLGWDDYVDELA